MLDFLEVTDAWYLNIRKLPTSVLIKMFKMGGKLQRWLAGD
jgi:hypothetical protein